MNYVEVTFVVNPLLPARDILVAELAERGFESFVETDNGLMAYIQEPDFSEEKLTNLALGEEQLTITHQLIQEQNWNAEWEKSFDPIEVDERIVVRAPFHEIKEVEFDIVIEPKMSFGTGHHATTFLMMQEMLGMEWTDKDVLDMGCGTAVLAILAEMKGADYIVAIDIDEWAYENSIENVERNNCTRIKCIKGGAEAIGEQSFDIILANINRNILTADAATYMAALNPGGEILLSGFYTMDIPILLQSFPHLTELRRHERNDWAMVHLTLPK